MGNSCESLQEGVLQLPVAPRNEPALSESPMSSTSREESPMVPATSMTSDDYPRLGLFGATTSPVSWKSSPCSSPVNEEWNAYDFIDEDDSPVIEPPVASMSLALPFLAFLPTTSCTFSDTPLRKRSRHVTFASSPTHSVHCSEFEIEPYSEVYGMHPRDFDFNEFGEQVPCGVGTFAVEDLGYNWHLGTHSINRADGGCNSPGGDDDIAEWSTGLDKWWGPPAVAGRTSGYPGHSQIQAGQIESLYSSMHVE